MFMQKLGIFASTETTLFRKTSSSKRKKMKEKKELHWPLSNLCGKNIHRDKNKYLNKWIMSVGLFCNDDRTPPFHPQENKNKTKQTYINLLRYPFFLFLLDFDKIPTIFSLRRCKSPVSSTGIVSYGAAAHSNPANDKRLRIWISNIEPR